MDVWKPPGESGIVRGRHRTVDRVAAILEEAARTRDGLTLSEVARRVGAPISSVQGLLNGLVAAGYLDERDRRYRLGGAPYLLNRIAGRGDIAAVGHPDLEALRRATGLTAVLAVAVGGHVYYVDYASGDPRFAYLAENYVQRSLIRTSSGWVLMAGMERRDLWDYLRGLEGEDRELIDELLAALPEIARTGICAGPAASRQGDGVSVAVVEGDRTVAAVGVISTKEEIAARRDELTETLRVVATAWVAGDGPES